MCQLPRARPRQPLDRALRFQPASRPLPPSAAVWYGTERRSTSDYLAARLEQEREPSVRSRPEQQPTRSGERATEQGPLRRLPLRSHTQMETSAACRGARGRHTGPFASRGPAQSARRPLPPGLRPPQGVVPRDRYGQSTRRRLLRLQRRLPTAATLRTQPLLPPAPRRQSASAYLVVRPPLATPPVGPTLRSAAKLHRLRRLCPLHLIVGRCLSADVSAPGRAVADLHDLRHKGQARIAHTACDFPATR